MTQRKYVKERDEDQSVRGWSSTPPSDLVEFGFALVLFIIAFAVTTWVFIQWGNAAADAERGDIPSFDWRKEHCHLSPSAKR